MGRTHKQPKCLQNKGKANKTIIGLITGIGLNLDKKLLLHRKNAKRTNGSIFTQPQYWGSRKQKNVGDVRLPKHVIGGHLICLRFMKHKIVDF